MIDEATERRHSAMRRIDDMIQAEWRVMRERIPPGGTIGVGSADFDHLLKATVGESFLRALRNGRTPEQAHDEAVKDGRECVRKWNKSGVRARASFGGPHAIHRWDQAGDGHADTFLRLFLTWVVRDENIAMLPEVRGGVGVAGRPVARMLADGWTVEITRVCTDGTPNGCSAIYGALRRAAKALGYLRVVTYTLEKENGSSLKASGFAAVAVTTADTWDRPGRKRATAKRDSGPKVRWERWVAPDHRPRASQ